MRQDQEVINRKTAAALKELQEKMDMVHEALKVIGARQACLRRDLGAIEKRTDIPGVGVTFDYLLVDPDVVVPAEKAPEEAPANPLVVLPGGRN
jgi:hypothetical protein